MQTDCAAPPPLLDRRHLRRRGGLAMSRLVSALPGRGLSRPCLFLHLPKCGGTSLAAGLCGTVPAGAQIGAVDALATRRAAALMHFGRDDLRLCHEDLPEGHLTFALRETVALTHLCAGARLVHGHLLATDGLLSACEGRYGLVTMMRDPAERALSNYRMAVKNGVIADDPDAWLKGPVGRSMGQVYLRYLSGRNVVRGGEESAALARAFDTLEAFEVVGFLDRAEAFRTAFAARFGARPAMPGLNRAAGPAPTLSAGQRAALDALTAPDRLIYDRARALFAGAAGPARAGRQATDRARSPAGQPARA